MKEESTSRAVAKRTHVTDRELLLEWHAAKEYVMKVERALLRTKEYMKKVELALLEAKVDAESLRLSVKGLVSQKSPISPREREVFDGIMRHLFNKEIASELHISVRTVKFHVSSLLSKFRVRGRMELVREAARHTATPMTVPPPVAPREVRHQVPPPHTYHEVARSSGPIALNKRQLLA